MKFILLLIMMLFPMVLISQKATKINKYSIAIEVSPGHSFPSFEKEQDRWKGVFYPAGSLNILFANRINQNWISDIGVGITGYALTNKGKTDNYILDFASPTFSTGLSYNFIRRKGQENFIKLTSGLQLGYKGNFEDKFETYSVRILGKDKLYKFIRPEIGIRKYFKQRMKGSKYKIGYELGAYFRYNLNRLGTAKIEEEDFEVTLNPRGNIIGGYFKILIPAGKKKVRIKQESAMKIDRIIYNPRYL